MYFMKRPSYLSLTIVAAIALLISVVAFRGYSPYTNRGLPPRQAPSIVLAMQDAYLVGMGHHGKLWSVRADKVEMSRNQATTTLSGIHDGKIYNNGKVALKVDAGRAVYDVYGRNLYLDRGITIEGSDGQKVTGRMADWNSALGVLRSHGEVSFETRWSKIITRDLVVDMKNRQMEMRGVRMLVNLEDAAGETGAEGIQDAR